MPSAEQADDGGAIQMTTATAASALAQELETLRNAQVILTGAIQHAKEEALDPAWRDRVLGLRLRLEKTSVAIIGRELDQIEGSL
jgi:isocitrate/isopropylmalate dehydrogenase